MKEQLAIKRSDAWFWYSNLTRADIMSRLAKRRIFHDWLVCPQGSADRAVTVGEFLNNPAVFQQQEEQAAAAERHRRAIVASVEKTPLLRIGEKLIRLFCACLMIGGITVKLFFPHMLGAGLTPVTLTILVPIWSIGGIGVVVWVLGWLQHTFRAQSALKKGVNPNRSLKLTRHVEGACGGTLESNDD